MQLVNYPNLAQMVFNTPLMAKDTLAEAIAGFMAPRVLGLISGDAKLSAKEPQSYPIGDPEVGNQITVIKVHGILVPRAGVINACEELMSYERLQNQISRAVNDSKTLAIVLDFQSGGGSAQAAFECARFIKNASKTKPIHAIINYNAFSAAYLLASACTDIYISDTGGVGSIGVYYKRLDLSKKYELEGIKIHTFSRGGTKTFGHPDIEISDEEREATEASMEVTYQMFVDYVAEFRGLERQAVIETEADTFLGKSSIEIGLADHLMTPQEAINTIAAKLTKKTSRSIRAQAALAAL